MKFIISYIGIVILVFVVSTGFARRVPEGSMKRVHTVKSDDKPVSTVPAREGYTRVEQRFNPYTRKQEIVIVRPDSSKAAEGGSSSGSTFEPIVHPSDKDLLKTEVASLSESVEASLAKPILVKFTPEQFEKLAADLVKSLYVVDTTSGRMGMGVTFRSHNGTITTTPKLSFSPTREPTTQMLIEEFSAGESFLLIRKVPMKAACARCEGTGHEKTGQYLIPGREPDVRYSQCTRCHGAKTVTVSVDMVHRVELKRD